MEAGLVGVEKVPISERTRFGLAIEKAGWPHQRRDALDRLRAGNARLDLEPFVEHQRIGAVARLEGGERLGRLGLAGVADAPGSVSAAARSVMLLARLEMPGRKRRAARQPALR